MAQVQHEPNQNIADSSTHATEPALLNLDPSHQTKIA